MSPPSPIPPPPPVRVTGGLENGSTTAGEAKSPSAFVSPLKAAADLIQTLDLAYAEMSTCAADAARDAEEARRNARTASEIARRYLNRSYPKGPSNFGSTPTSKLELLGGRPADQRGEYKEEILGPSLETPSSPRFHSLNGAMTNGSKPNTPTSADRRKHFFVSNSPSRSRVRTYNPTSSADRIAQSHAEDVLTLSLELERARQAFQSEQRMHDETKTALSTQKVKANALQEENKKLKEQLELFQREKAQQVADLQQELTKAKYLAQAAEEDAQLALDLAKESSEKRDAMEEELQRTLAELRLLKDQPPPVQLETPRRTVHFMDESPAASVEVVPNSQNGGSTPSRSMVAAGRQILRRSFATSPGEEIITLELTPAKSAERRRRLRERLTQLDDSSPLALQPSTQQPKSPQRPVIESEDCRNAAKLLQESGRRLELAGHWWRKGLANSAPINEMEAMTRQYCQSVEFKVERQQKEIKELESLCGFLERKLVTGNGES